MLLPCLPTRVDMREGRQLTAATQTRSLSAALFVGTRCDAATPVFRWANMEQMGVLKSHVAAVTWLLEYGWHPCRSL